MTTIRDIAREANVSPSTVSLVLNGRGRVNEQTRQRVVSTAHRLQYETRGPGRPSRHEHPGRAESAAHTLNVAVLYVPRPDLPDAISDLSRDWVTSIRQALTDTGDHFSLFSGAAHVDQDAMFRHIVAQGEVDGAILMGIRPSDGYLDHLLSAALPVVVMNRRPCHGEFSYVAIDNYGGSVQAIQHLHSHGHRRLAMIHGATPELCFPADRLAGAQAAASQLGLSLDPVHTVHGKEQANPAALAPLCRQIAESGVTGVYINGDELAAICIDLWEGMGVRVPRDISVIGFDDLGLAVGSQAIRLTSIGFDKERMAQQAVTILRSLLTEDQGMASAGITASAWVADHDTVTQATG